ncbi:hypothetical protein [Pseudomonas sp. Y24-6]|uniref:hypothetical protein n=1 Tax=Pseudomonas sp. Y24-6 TaxID=2750013 RepID=UPI00298C41DB|nr:hypothetical protein [Pseudomonas sp. Y24-6]
MPALDVAQSFALQWRCYPPGVQSMTSVEDFRIQSHALLIELDAATMGMMLLVSARCVSGPAWDEATQRHHDAYELWNAFLNVPDSGLDAANQ